MASDESARTEAEPRAPFRVPDPVLRTVRNATPFVHASIDKMGPGRRFHDVVVVKGTFTLAPGVLRLADEQVPIRYADRYRRPEDGPCTSVEHAGDVLLYKPATDVLVTGTARAPGGRASAGWDTAVVVRGARGTISTHTARASGPTRWEHRALGGWRLSTPEPAVEVPLRYELAYGGGYPDRRRPGRWILHEPNPSGTGFFDARALDTSRTYPGPQWHPAEGPIATINDTGGPLVGYGPVSRAWLARRQYGGTYDDVWLEAARAGLRLGVPADYAEDFDLRFFQCAHPALVAPRHFAGDEVIGLRGMARSAETIGLTLPGIGVVATLITGKETKAARRLPLDTVHVDLDAELVELVFRLCLDQRDGVREVILTLDERTST